jgi:hypothetical protein
MIERKGIIWVVDGRLGHLSSAHRGGALLEMLQEPTRLFYTIEEVKKALPAKFPPTALIIGYCDIPKAVNLLNSPQLNQLPVLITDAHGLWPRDDLPKSVVMPKADVYSTRGAIEYFVDNVLGRRW